MVPIDAQKKSFLVDRTKIEQKMLLHKNMLIIRLTIKMLLLAFIYFIICLRNKKNVTMILKTVTLIRVPKVPFRFFEKLKNEIQNFIL